MFMTLLDVSVTNVALPSIGRDLGTGNAELQWIVSGYTLAFGLVPVLGGKLGDDHGRRLMFQVGVGGFAVTSLLSGLAPTAGVLIGARVLQGLAGGLINPQTSGLVQQMFHGADRGRAFGVLGTTVGLGTAIGPLVGGLLIGLGGPTLGWRLVFFVNIPIAVVVILLSRRLLPAPTETVPHRLDLLGAAYLGLATFCVLFALVEYDVAHDTRLAWLGVPAALLFGLFLRRERRLTNQLPRPSRRPAALPPAVLRRRDHPRARVLPGDGGSPAGARALLPARPRLHGRRVGAGRHGVRRRCGHLGPARRPRGHPVGRPLVVAGAVTFGVGAVALALIAPHVPPGHAALALALPLFVMGCGQGAVITPNQTLALMDVDPLMGSTAGGVLQTGQRIGLAIGQALIGTVFFNSLAGPGHASYAHALRNAVIAALCFIALAVAIGLQDLLRARRRTPSLG